MLYLLDRFPFFDRAAAKRWFKQYVADPIPSHINNLRGGYRGDMNRGIIIVTFDFEPPFDRPFFPKDWKPRDVSVAGALMANLIESHIGTRPKTSKGYIKPLNEKGGGSAWLLIDETGNKGVLYESGYYPQSSKSDTL